jgi:hypothetical protein
MKITDLRGIELVEGDEVLVELAAPKLFAKVYKIEHGGVKLPGGGETQALIYASVVIPCMVVRKPGTNELLAPAMLKLPNAVSEALGAALAASAGPVPTISPFEKPRGRGN